MGDLPSAIALLEANAKAYPRSGGAAFGLGRAYKSAGKLTQAKKELERAVGLDPSSKRAQEALQSLR
ncbi:MAG: tetratricopeptide repeat protein [Chthoniobacterales bacterium]